MSEKSLTAPTPLAATNGAGTSLNGARRALTGALAGAARVATGAAGAAEINDEKLPEELEIEEMFRNEENQLYLDYPELRSKEVPVLKPATSLNQEKDTFILGPRAAVLTESPNLRLSTDSLPPTPPPITIRPKAASPILKITEVVSLRQPLLQQQQQLQQQLLLQQQQLLLQQQKTIQPRQKKPVTAQSTRRGKLREMATSFNTAHVAELVQQALKIHKLSIKALALGLLKVNIELTNQLLKKPRPWKQLTRQEQSCYRVMSKWLQANSGERMDPFKEYFKKRGLPEYPSITADRPKAASPAASEASDGQATSDLACNDQAASDLESNNIAAIQCPRNRSAETKELLRLRCLINDAKKQLLKINVSQEDFSRFVLKEALQPGQASILNKPPKIRRNCHQEEIDSYIALQNWLCLPPEKKLEPFAKKTVNQSSSQNHA